MSIMKPPFHTELNLGHRMSQGIVGCWLFNEAPPPLGSAMDLSVNGNHGTLFGDTHSVPGKFGPALEFDGDNDYIDVGKSDALQFGSDSFTVVAEVKPISVAGDKNIIGDKRGGTSTVGFRLTIDSNDLEVNLGDGTNNPTVKSVSPEFLIVANVWQRVVAVIDRDAGNVILYKDDSQTFTGAIGTLGSISESPDNVLIGIRPTSLNQDFNGQIDYIYIYNRALNANEIKELYRDPFQMFKRNL